MPYLGNTPSTSFATVVKDSFSGDGSTVAFTLSKVATTNSVSVFVENVRQEPTTAYAVSGTTLTFTAAPVTSSGNNIYVLHMNPTTTTTHPAAQNLTAVDGTFTGTVTAGSTLDMNGTELILDADADTSITADTDDRIDFRFGGTDSVHMDVTGVGVNLTNPLYPFHARAASGGDTAALFLEGPNNGYSALYMGDTDTIGQNSIVANHATDELVFTTGNKVRFNIGASANTGTAANVDILEAPTYLTMADDSSFTVNLGHAGVIVLSNASTGKAGFFFYQYISGLTELADPSGHLATSDSDGSLCIYKSATNGNNYVIKNRVGSSRAISIAVFATGV